MKVRDLIERLSRLDPDLTVVIPLGTPETIARCSYELGAVEVVRLFDADLGGARR